MMIRLDKDEIVRKNSDDEQMMIVKLNKSFFHMKV